METLQALRAEAEALTSALSEMPAAAWDRPTRCDPWRVRDVVGHVITALGRVPVMIAAPAPAAADTTAPGYYRPDERFGSTTDADRISTAQNRADAPPPMLVEELADTWRTVVTVSESQPPDRVVHTRHGDAMLLTDFLATRVIELALHGLDIADGAGSRPWLTPAATEVVLETMFGAGWRTVGWDQETLVRKSTGRAPVSAAEIEYLRGAGYCGDWPSVHRRLLQVDNPHYVNLSGLAD